MMVIPSSSSSTTTTLALVILLLSVSAGSYVAGIGGRVVDGFSLSTISSPGVSSSRVSGTGTGRRHRYHRVDVIVLLKHSSKSSPVLSTGEDDGADDITSSATSQSSTSSSSSLLSTTAAAVTTACCCFCCLFGGGGYGGGGIAPVASAAYVHDDPPSSVLTAAAISPPSSLYNDISKILNHNYDDPLHPQCLRAIKVDRSDPSIFHFKGTRVDGGNGGGNAGSASDDDDNDNDNDIEREQFLGCSYIEIRDYGPLKNGAFDGKIIIESDGGDNVNSAIATSVGPIDLMRTTVKLDAGDGVHVGVWEPAATTTSLSSTLSQQRQKYSDVDGIRWNDGNKWIVQKKPIGKSIGEAIFLAYIGFSTLAGFKGVYDAIQRKRTSERQ